MDFAVQPIDGDGTKGTWVLDVDHAGERFLLADDEGKLFWSKASKYKLLKVAHPDVPRPVIPLAGQQKPGIVLPGSQFGRN